MQVWYNLDYFDKDENWGDSDKIDHLLLFALDGLRDYLKTPITILNAFAVTGHSDGSQHYKGKACDFTVPDLEYMNTFYAIMKYLNNTKVGNRVLADIVGFGIYPQNNFFHLDVRGYKSRWGRIDGEYVNFTKAMEYLNA